MPPCGWWPRGGVGAATVRAIAREVGVTEGAVYRHYESKDELLCQAYAKIVDEMYAAKRHLLEVDWPISRCLHEWVRLTYEYFDREPDAFTYVLLTPHNQPESQRNTGSSQGTLFKTFYGRAAQRGLVRRLDAETRAEPFRGRDVERAAAD